MLPCRLGGPRARMAASAPARARNALPRSDRRAQAGEAPDRPGPKVVRSTCANQLRYDQALPVRLGRAPRGHGRGDPGRAHRRRRGFVTGVLLMAGSFLVYPVYPVLVLWPVSDRTRVGTTLVAAVVSWVVFSTGLYLAGRRGWVWLRRRWKGHRHQHAPPPPSATP